jgi:hypothetical protein
MLGHTYKTPTWGKKGKIDRKNEQNQWKYNMHSNAYNPWKDGVYFLKGDEF